MWNTYLNTLRTACSIGGAEINSLGVTAGTRWCMRIDIYFWWLNLMRRGSMGEILRQKEKMVCSLDCVTHWGWRCIHAACSVAAGNNSFQSAGWHILQEWGGTIVTCYNNTIYLFVFLLIVWKEKEDGEQNKLTQVWLAPNKSWANNCIPAGLWRASLQIFLFDLARMLPSVRFKICST